MSDKSLPSCLRRFLRVVTTCAIGLTTSFAALAADLPDAAPDALARTSIAELGSRLRVGDLVFIRVSALPFRRVASATGSWTNHVGIVIDVSGPEPVIGESTFPVSRATSLSRFVHRSEAGRVGVARLNVPLTSGQQRAVLQAAKSRMGVMYDTGFDLHSKRQFCSRYVREVVAEATGTRLGEVEDFSTLLMRNPDTELGFWKVWYFGRIPWQRQTVTPASVLQSRDLHAVFDGYATPQPRLADSAQNFHQGRIWMPCLCVSARADVSHGPVGNCDRARCAA